LDHTERVGGSQSPRGTIPNQANIETNSQQPSRHQNNKPQQKHATNLVRVSPRKERRRDRKPREKKEKERERERERERGKKFVGIPCDRNCVAVGVAVIFHENLISNCVSSRSVFDTLSFRVIILRLSIVIKFGVSLLNLD
jgi:hypothetical protein